MQRPGGGQGIERLDPKGGGGGRGGNKHSVRMHLLFFFPVYMHKHSLADCRGEVFWSYE